MVALGNSSRWTLLWYFDLLMHRWYIVSTLLYVRSDRGFTWWSGRWGWWESSFAHLFHIVLWCRSSTSYWLAEPESPFLARFVVDLCALFLRSCLLNVSCGLISYVRITHHLDVIMIVDMNRRGRTHVLWKLHLVVCMILQILRLLFCLKSNMYIDLSRVVKILLSLPRTRLSLSILVRFLGCRYLWEHLEMLCWYGWLERWVLLLSQYFCGDVVCLYIFFHILINAECSVTEFVVAPAMICV